MSTDRIDVSRADDPTYYWMLCKPAIQKLIKAGVYSEEQLDVIIKDAIEGYKQDDAFVFHLSWLDEWEEGELTGQEIADLLRATEALIRYGDPDQIVFDDRTAKMAWRHMRDRIEMDKKYRKITSIQRKINGYAAKVK